MSSAGEADGRSWTGVGDADPARVRVRVPEHVIYRTLASETVLLNLRKGTYHGLNDVAGDMLVSLERSPSVAAAARQLAQEYDEAEETILAGLGELVGSLVERGLVEVDRVEGGHLDG